VKIVVIYFVGSAAFWLQYVDPGLIDRLIVLNSMHFFMLDLRETNITTVSDSFSC
jgi:hypothetical protein